MALTLLPYISLPTLICHARGQDYDQKLTWQSYRNLEKSRQETEARRVAQKRREEELQAQKAEAMRIQAAQKTERWGTLVKKAGTSSWFVLDLFPALFPTRKLPSLKRLGSYGILRS
jgi:hypothetical protein